LLSASWSLAGRWPGRRRGRRTLCRRTRVQFQQRLAHPGLPVDPAAQPALLLQPVQPGHPFVTGQDPAQIAALAGELLDRLGLGRFHQRWLQRLEFAAAGVVEPGGQPGDRVQVSGGHFTSGQGIVETGHLGAGLGALGGRFGILRRSPAVPGEQRPRRFAGALVGEFAAGQGDAGVERVQPAAHPLGVGDQVGEAVAVAAERVGGRKLGHQFDDTVPVHTYEYTNQFGDVNTYACTCRKAADVA
jgi:hypothetical protein